ncbi:uncharacterized protein KD926_011685 [Aspergillus affinis]|uniref:uncharacterized protein n=1 Tax=Aspergillus affinis TaxID=1070780 RepID=UPI0022FDDEAA|nr:uncharacterized protein KD926_011685 [Aspergillus affinis]KAI9044715.1 hypothetical protein KD926_011685 [Aspergillus affinis]
MNLNPNPNPAFGDPTIATTTTISSAPNPDPNPTFNTNLSFQNTLIPSPPKATPVTSAETTTLTTPSSYPKTDSKPTFNINLSFQNTLVPSPKPTPLPTTTETTAPKTTTYHIYPTPQNPSHALITQHDLPKSTSARRKLLKQNPSFLSSTSTNTSTSTTSDPIFESQSPPPKSYYLHLPTLTFHSPPRTLRRGANKTDPPVCIIHNSPFWKRWRILTGPELLAAIDPRGLLPYERRSCAGNKPRRDGEVKGYRVRKWRAYGESRKGYFRKVNDERKKRKMKCGGGDYDGDRDREGMWDPVCADEVLPVTWVHATPFSTRVRWYSFMYEGVQGAWKGSREIPVRKKWARRVMPVHHLKLVVKGYGIGSGSLGKKGGGEYTHQDQDQDRDYGFEKKMESEGDEEGEEVVLARYSSSLSCGKHGTLVIFDEEVRRVLGCQDLVRSRKDFACNREKGIGVVDEYDVIVATAMCMILGEEQKRNTVLQILLALAEAAGGA